MKNLFKACLLILGIVFLSPQSAFAHATPVSYSPESSVVLSEGPKQVVIHFTERIDAAGSNIAVFAPDGSEVDDNILKVNETDRRIFSVGLNSSQTGTYTVSWQVVSADDGHFTRGGYSFSVGSVTATAVSAQTEVVFYSRVGDGIATGLELVGQGVLWALLISLPLLRGGKGDQGSKEGRVFSWLTLGGVGLVGVGTVLYIGVKAQDLSLLRSLDFTSALKIFLATAAGKFALARLGLALLFLFVYTISRRKIFSALKITKAEKALYIVLVFMAVARVASSHAAAAHFLPLLTWIDHLVHMIFKGLWAGLALVSVILIWPKVFKSGKLNEVFRTLNRLSNFFTIIFTVVGVTGAYIVWLDLKNGGNVFTTDWGTRFLILSAFGGVLMLLRLISQVYVQWELFRAVRRAISILKVAAVLEAVAGIGLLIATGFIMITTPPVWNKNVFERSFESQGAIVRVQEHPTENSFLKISTNSGPVKDLVVTLTNEEKSIGPIVAVIEQRTDNSFVLSKNELAVPGKWKMEVTATQPQGYDLTGAVEFNFPADVEAGRLDQSQRTFGWFEITVIANALGILLTGLVLLWLNRYFRNRFEAQLSGQSLDLPLLNVSGTNYALSVVGLVLVLTLIWVAIPVMAKSPFQRACERARNAWHTMVSTRNSTPVSESPSAGCMLGTGQFHISSFNEYKYFSRIANPQVSLNFGSAEVKAGSSTKFEVVIRDENNQPMENLAIQHERILHAIIISEDFKTFSHIHVEDQPVDVAQLKKTGVFPLLYTFPAAGKYLVAIDFAVNAQSFSRTFPVDVSGSPQIGEKVPNNFSLVKNFDGYTVSLATAEGFITAGEQTTFKYQIRKDNEPVLDLQPYLSAAMHIAIVKDDLTKFTHTHGEVHPPGQVSAPTTTHFHAPPPAQFGPDVEAHAVFEEPGIYHIFGEFKHQGKVIPTEFVVEVQ